MHHSLAYARDMDAALAGKFIGMYVNDFTRDYGETGRAAIRQFLGEARAAGYIDIGRSTSSSSSSALLLWFRRFFSLLDDE